MISRRKIIGAAIAGGVVAAITWYKLSTPSLFSTPTLSSSPMLTTSPSPTPTSTPSSSPTPSVIPPPTETISEDEKMVREFLEKDWVETFNSNNLDRMLSLYTEDAMLFSEPSYSYRGLRGDHSLSWHYNYNFSHHWRIVYYKIAAVNISDNKAEVLSYVTADKGPGTTMGLSEYSRYKLRKITEITKGRVTKPIWRIYDEYDAWAY